MELSRIIVAIALLMACTLPASAHEPSITLDAEFRHENNISNSSGKDKLGDWVGALGGSVAQGIALGEHSGLLLTAGLRYDGYRRYTDMSHMTLLGDAKYRIQPILGFTEPWLEIHASAEFLKYNHSPIRDGEILDVSASLGKHFTDRIQGSVGLGLDARQAELGNTFDFTQHRLFAKLDYRLGEKAMLYLNATRVFGDVVSTETPPSALYPASKSVTSDTALSAGAVRNAYRIGAQTNILDLGLNYPLGEIGAVDVGMQYHRSRISASDAYEGYMVRAGYIYRF